MTLRGWHTIRFLAIESDKQWILFLKVCTTDQMGFSFYRRTARECGGMQSTHIFPSTILTSLSRNAIYLKIVTRKKTNMKYAQCLFLLLLLYWFNIGDLNSWSFYKLNHFSDIAERIHYKTNTIVSMKLPLSQNSQLSLFLLWYE